MEEKLFLAADSGGSKTVWIVFNSNGDIIKEFKTAGVAAIKEGILPVFEIIKEAYNKISDNLKSIYFSLGGPNTQEVEKSLKKFWKDIPVLVDREANGNAMIPAAHFLNCSAVVMCGTGSVAIGEINGERKFSGGWGPIYGDGGSGGGLGSDALKLFLNSVDNGDNIGLLFDVFSPLLSGLDIKKFEDRMELKNRAVNMSRSELASKAPEIYNSAEQGDNVCLSLYKDSADKIAELAKNVSDNKKESKILLCGGFLKNKPLLLKLCEEAFSKISEASLLYVPEFSPIVAARIRALEINNIEINKELFIKILNQTKEN